MIWVATVVFAVVSLGAGFALGWILEGRPRKPPLPDYSYRQGEGLMSWGARQPRIPDSWPSGKCACGNCQRAAGIVP